MNNRLRVRWPVVAALLLQGLHAQGASAQVLADVTVRFPGLLNVPQCSKWETPEISIREPGVVKVSIWLKPYVGSVGWEGGQLFIPLVTQEMGSGGWSGWGGQSRFCCGPLTPADLARYGTPQTGKWIQNGMAVGNLTTGVELYTESLARQDRPLRMQFGVMPRCYGSMVYGMRSQDQQEVRLRVDFFPDSTPPGRRPSENPQPPPGGGSTGTLPPHVIVGADGRLQPGPGYTWETREPNDYRVRWDPGREHSGAPHVLAGTREGTWVPAPGYGWVSDKPGDLRVEPSAGGGETPGCAREVELYTNNNVFSVSSGPTQPTRFTLDTAVHVSSILTYHWNSGRGQPPGSISLVHQDGTRYGPWTTAGAPGSGGVQNANWIARPQVVLKPGTYTVIDSHTNSWAQNAQSNNQGIVVVKGCSVR